MRGQCASVPASVSPAATCARAVGEELRGARVVGLLRHRGQAPGRAACRPARGWRAVASIERPAPAATAAAAPQARQRHRRARRRLPARLRSDTGRPPQPFAHVARGVRIDQAALEPAVRVDSLVVKCLHPRPGRVHVSRETRTSSASDVVPSASQRAPSRRNDAVPARAAAARSAILRRAVVDQPPQRVVDDDEFVDAGPAAVAGVAALAAAGRRIERQIRRQAQLGQQRGLACASARAQVRHAGQSVRTSRCASTPSRLDASRYGSTPMSARRVIALAASLVCSVASTRCPVSEACTAICAVSRSRISPIMMMSGSWRRIARSARAKSRSMRGLTCVCADAVERVLDRVLDRHHVERSARQPRQRGVERRRLAGTGRAGDENDAVRLADQAVDRVRASSRSCRAPSGRAAPNPCRAAAAPRARPVRSATSIPARRPACRPASTQCRPSCGSRFSAMSRLAMIFSRETSAACSARGGSSTSRSTPSMRKRTTERASYGSKCRSDARSRSACSSSALIIRITGACVAAVEQVLGWPAGPASAARDRSRGRDPR